VSDATCKTCPHWAPACRDPGALNGECRNVEALRFRHTETTRDYWCSEHPALQRDHLAAMAMQGLLACGLHVPNGPDPATFLVDQAYRIADAMLATRASPPVEGAARGGDK